MTARSDQHEASGTARNRRPYFRQDSRIAAPIAVYEALFGDHDKALGRGERAVIPIVAQDLKATRIAYGYIRSDLTESKLLAGEVHEVLASEIRPERDLLTEVANRLRGMTGTRAIPARRDDRTRW